MQPVQAGMDRLEKEPLMSSHAEFGDAGSQLPVARAVVIEHPAVQDMSRAIIARSAEVEDFFGPELQGILVRERSYLSQILCGACERQAQFKVASWDPSISDEAPDEVFTSRPAMFQVREESDCIMRYCCHQFRELRLGMFPIGGSMYEQGEAPGWPTGVNPILVMDKPFKCPIVCCCFMPFPFEVKVSRPASPNVPAQYFGKVVFDWRWYNCCWPCDMHSNVYDGVGNLQFRIHQPMACGSGCRNICAPSCCNRTHRTSIIAPNGRVAGEILNVWPGWNARGLCQGNSGADNFILKFPAKSNPVQKALLMASLFHHNFIFWERRGNQK